MKLVVRTRWPDTDPVVKSCALEEVVAMKVRAVARPRTREQRFKSTAVGGRTRSMMPYEIRSATLH